MSFLKRLFSKKGSKETTENLNNVKENAINQNSSNIDFETAYGDTVLLTHDEVNDDIDLFNEPVRLKTEEILDDNIYDSEKVVSQTEPVECQIYEDDTFGEICDAEEISEYKHDINQGSNDDTVILSKANQYHSGDTVVLNKNVSTIPNNIFLINPMTGEKVSVSKSEFKIGSDSQFVDLTCAGSGVSRHHASLYVDDESRCFIVDNDSTNGTEVDGVCIEPFKKYQLENGVLIKFANDIYQFFIDGEVF